jgi:transmembrane sensor
VEERETSQDIDRIAAQWVARMDRAPLSAGESGQLKQWLAGDPRRRGAYLRAKAVWMRSESARALGPQYDPANFQPEAAAPPSSRVRRRRPVMEWAGAMAASLVLVVTLAVTLQMPTAYATAKGEMRMVPLGEGAMVTLNTETRIKVYDDKGQRRIRVLQGEVLFDGAATVVPTWVEIDGTRLEATAATFVVRKLQGRPIQVLVQAGRVVLADAGRSTKIPLAPNTGLSLAAGKKKQWKVASLPPGQLGRELAWREGKIALQGETLAEAAAMYARYSDTPIVIADRNLAQMQVAGLFAANNPLGFSRAVAEVFGAEVRQENGRIIVAKPRSAMAPH